MDMFQAATYFDMLQFENFDFATGTWGDTYFEGQLKKADTFQSIYHRPTRKRMMFTPPDQPPSSPVVRVVATGEEFIVGSHQRDCHDDVHYRNTYALHKPLGRAQIRRLMPQGPANNPGWGVLTDVANTFVDLELRSANENEEATPAGKSHYYATLPSNTDLRRYDLLIIRGLEYYVLESYIDSNMVLARTAQHKDPREDFVYQRREGADTYVNGKPAPNLVNYNVTARVGPLQADELGGSLSANSLKVKILEGWIGFAPSLNDRIAIYGSTYSVKRVIRDATEQEWNLIVSL